MAGGCPSPKEKRLDSKSSEGKFWATWEWSAHPSPETISGCLETGKWSAPGDGVPVCYSFWGQLLSVSRSRPSKTSKLPLSGFVCSRKGATFMSGTARFVMGGEGTDAGNGLLRCCPARDHFARESSNTVRQPMANCQPMETSLEPFGRDGATRPWGCSQNFLIVRCQRSSLT